LIAGKLMSRWLQTQLLPDKFFSTILSLALLRRHQTFYQKMAYEKQEKKKRHQINI